MAHEIGHNFGMSHDFVQKGYMCKRAIDGKREVCSKCTNWNGETLTFESGADGECCTGFMDYGKHPEYWSKCSVRNFRQHYVSQNWHQCMPLGKLLPLYIMELFIVRFNPLKVLKSHNINMLLI